MGKFLETHNVPIESWINRKSERTITSKEIKPIIKNLPTNKRPEPVSCAREFYQILKEQCFSNSSKWLNERQYFQSY